MALFAPSALAHRCSLFTMKTPASYARVFEWGFVLLPVA
jgi:hypothetical protein